MNRVQELERQVALDADIKRRMAEVIARQEQRIEQLKARLAEVNQ